ncbi:MAG: ABC transporter permease, partial [Micrococcales bacterium]|nr:ABC transporter permease [Micrococcales bacterium]
LMQLVPGDPARTSLGPDATAELVAQRRHHLGLDQPVLVQYLNYWKNVVQGNFGNSMLSNVAVSFTISSGLKNTMILVLVALCVTFVGATVIGIVIGVLTHSNRNQPVLATFTVIAGLTAALPQFLVAMALVYFFSVRLNWLPVAFATDWRSFVLPALAITGTSTAIMARVIRSQTEVVLGQDYIRVARAKRLPQQLIYRRHALPNVLTAGLTLSGLQFGSVVAASIIIEQVFSIPGLGQALIQGMIASDYPVVQAILLIFASAVLVVTLLVDILIGVLDPRSNLQDQ